jgi:hypothetical protein
MLAIPGKLGYQKVCFLSPKDEELVLMQYVRYLCYIGSFVGYSCCKLFELLNGVSAHIMLLPAFNM